MSGDARVEPNGPSLASVPSNPVPEGARVGYFMTSDKIRPHHLERKAILYVRQSSAHQVLHNRDLALFYADHDIKLDEALALAHKEFEVRHDIYTWDALAWALYKNGKYQEANDAMEHALRPGTRDALLFFHAGMIAGRSGQKSQAREKLQTALNINNTQLIFSEVTYDYTPTIGYVISGTLQLSDKIYMRPRLSDTVARVNS